MKWRPMSFSINVFSVADNGGRRVPMPVDMPAVSCQLAIQVNGDTLMLSLRDIRRRRLTAALSRAAA